MRKTLLIGMLGLLGLADVAQARDYPVCLRVYQNYHDWYDECSYDLDPAMPDVGFRTRRRMP